MADIFDTGSFEARNIQENAGTPSFVAPNRAAEVNVSTEDVFNLKASSRMKDIAKQEAARRAAEESTRAATQGVDTNLDNLAQGYIEAYRKIDQKYTNPIENSSRKRELSLSALTAAGKSGYSYINAITETLSTTREAREDGLVNILDSQGNIVGIDAGNIEHIKQAMADRNDQNIMSVLPNTLSALDSIYKKAEISGAPLSKNSLHSFRVELKDATLAMGEAGDNYHLLSNQLSTDKLENIKKQAFSKYLGATSSVFSTFTSPDILRALKSGNPDGINRSDLEMAMQQAKRDIINMAADSQLPFNIQDIEAYAQSQIEHITKAYDSYQKNDLIAPEVMQKQLETRLAIRKAMAEGQMNIPELEAANKVVEFQSKNVGIAASLSAEPQNPSTSREQKDMFTQTMTGATRTTQDVMPLLDRHNAFLYQSGFDLQDSMDSLKAANTRDSFLGFAKRLSKVTSHTDGWSMAPQVSTVVQEMTPKLISLIEAGEITPDEGQEIVNQLGQYKEDAISIIRKRGSHPEEYEQESQESIGFLSKTWNMLYPLASPINTINTALQAVQKSIQTLGQAPK